MILRALEILAADSPVIELRALQVGPKQYTVGGYFDEREALAEAAMELTRLAAGIYITLNPINAALLARSPNKTRVAGYSTLLTTDADVLKRLWLPVDVDAVRPAGISASDAEHQAALARAVEIREFLDARGWRTPVFCDSGGGAHLLYRVELPAQDGGLVKRCLRALAFQFDDDTIKIDQDVSNAGRIWRLPGTLNRKGYDTPERPHRLAKLLVAPAAGRLGTTVAADLLEKLARMLPEEPGTTARGKRGRGAFNLDQWISVHIPNATGPMPWNQNGRRWVLPVCPWNPEHRRSAYVVQFGSGAIAAGCRHASCADKDWRALRQLYEPAQGGEEGKNRDGGDADEGRLRSAQLGDQILAEDHFARDAGGRLYRYRDGVYRSTHPTADRFVLDRVAELAAEQQKQSRWNPRLANDVVEWVRCAAPDLSEHPPVDSVNLLNGILDLETMELGPHSPELLLSIQIPIMYDPAATCPAIDNFIAEVFPADCITLAWEILGDLLTPDRSIPKAILLVGEGGGGKSTFLSLAAAFVGRQNVSNASLHRLESDRFAVATLYHRLADVCADLPSEHLASTSMFKNLTGGDTICGEYKFREIFFFTPYCRLLFSANHPPGSKDASKAFYDRWIPIPFERSFRGTEQELPRSVLDARLTAPSELSGALNKALVALRRVRSLNRFTWAPSVERAMQQFHEVTDPLAVWLDRNTLLEPGAVITQNDLVTAYNKDSETNARPLATKQAFGRALHRLRPEIKDAQRTVRGKVQWVYIGIALEAPEEISQARPIEAKLGLDDYR